MMNKREASDITRTAKTATAPVLALVLGAMVALAAAGCAGAAVEGGEPGSRMAADAERGAEVWRTTCYRCHNRRPANEFTVEQWPVIVDHMRTRAHLTRSEAEAVAAFLQELAGSS